MTQKYLQKCVSISPSPLDIYDSIRSEFDQVPTFCEPLFGSATQVMMSPWLLKMLPTSLLFFQI